jgi:hypothetical protein
MLAHGGDVALLLVPFVPLIMVVKDHGYEIVETDHEAIMRSVVDQAMEALVELREVGESAFGLLEQDSSCALRLHRRQRSSAISHAGQPVTPREWFLVPLFVVDEAIERIKDGTIADYRYDPKTASLLGTQR